MTVNMRTASDLEHLLAEVESGCVQQRMLTWLMASNRMFTKDDVIMAEVKEDEYASAMRNLREHENSVHKAGNNNKYIHSAIFLVICIIYTCNVVP